MSPHAFSALLVCLLSAGCIIVVLLAFKHLLRKAKPNLSRMFPRVVAAALLWTILLGVLSGEGVFTRPSLPPPPMLAVAVALVFLLLLSFMPWFKTVLRTAPLHWLVAFQAFRIGVELWFWYSYQAGVFPKIMTFEGANFDIIAGLLALPAAWAIRRGVQPKLILVLFNIAGVLLLLHTLRAAALSMPSPLQQYPFDKRLLLLGTFPFIYLPGILVAMALGAHMLSLRQWYLHRPAIGNAAKTCTSTALL